MKYVEWRADRSVAIVTYRRGKVNAYNADSVAELNSTLDRLQSDDSVRAIVLTGSGSFFSFGFDVPEFVAGSREAFTTFVRHFTALYARLYEFPKPVIGALNGHAVAGGCMIAVACDRRVMAGGRAKIGLNEITFGASVFAGIALILRELTGQRHAERILFTGELFHAERAAEMGLVDQVCDPAEVLNVACEIARGYARSDPTAYAHLKRLVREPIGKAARDREPDSIARFIDLWYTPRTQEMVRKIVIR